MTPLLQTLLKDDRGQSLVEYALIISLVSIAAIAALTLLGNKVNTTFYAPAANAFP